MSTILIKNARMRGHQELTDLYIKDGVFAEIGGGLSYPADEIIDVAGKLVSAPFCDAHLHLDAVLSVGKPRYNMSGTLIEGINIWGERMQGLTKETIKKNARDVIKWEVANGSMFLRTHADATEPTGTVVEALLEVREEMKDLVDLQIVAFPQECIFTEKGHTDLMENAMPLAAYPTWSTALRTACAMSSLSLTSRKNTVRSSISTAMKIPMTSPALWRQWHGKQLSVECRAVLRQAIPPPCTITIMTSRSSS